MLAETATLYSGIMSSIHGSVCRCNPDIKKPVFYYILVMLYYPAQLLVTLICGYADIYGYWNYFLVSLVTKFSNRLSKFPKH